MKMIIIFLFVRTLRTHMKQLLNNNYLKTITNVHYCISEIKITPNFIQNS